jgi:hypothetical protein
LTDGLEDKYLVRLKQDLQMETERIDRALIYIDNRMQAVQLLERVAHDPDVNENTQKLLPWAIETAGWRSFPRIAAFVYNELQSSGNLALIQSESLRRNLAAHYASIQHDSDVAFDLTAQHQFEQQTLGLLTSSELVKVENSGGDNRALDIDKARGQEIVQRFRQNISAIALLPSLMQHHAFNKRVINAARERTTNLITQIDELLPQQEK